MTFNESKEGPHRVTPRQAKKNQSPKKLSQDQTFPANYTSQEAAAADLQEGGGGKA